VLTHAEEGAVMKILVAYASRMGSTAEIAGRIADQLRAAGHVAETSPCTEAPGADRYDAVILGSALYVGRWDATATRYLKAQAVALAQRPTWLFQSGPCGPGAAVVRVATPRAVRRLAARIGLAAPATFGGRLDRSLATTRICRWMATGAYAGDFRDWDTIQTWTAMVLAELAAGRRSLPLPKR
jgi:menaquinone-dependent protoporphyrinogen oxidase